MSSGLARARRAAWLRRRKSSNSLPAMSAVWVPSMMISPGLIAFTRILSGASSFPQRLRYRVHSPLRRVSRRRTSPAGELTTELMLITLLPSAREERERRLSYNQQALGRLCRTGGGIRQTVTRSREAKPYTPALFTGMSTLPYAFRTLSKSAWTSASRKRSRARRFLCEVIRMMWIALNAASGIRDVPAGGCVRRRAPNWSRFNFCWAYVSVETT